MESFGARRAPRPGSRMVSIRVIPGVAMPSERSEMEDMPDRRSDIEAAIVTKPSPWSTADTLARLSAVVAARGREVCAFIDHCAKARAIGLDLGHATLEHLGSP